MVADELVVIACRPVSILGMTASGIQIAFAADCSFAGALPTWLLNDDGAMG